MRSQGQWRLRDPKSCLNRQRILNDQLSTTRMSCHEEQNKVWQNIIMYERWYRLLKRLSFLRIFDGAIAVASIVAPSAAIPWPAYLKIVTKENESIEIWPSRLRVLIDVFDAIASARSTTAAPMLSLFKRKSETLFSFKARNAPVKIQYHAIS